MRPPEEQPLRAERRRGALILTINREGRRNALSRQTLLALGRARQMLTPQDRAVVVTGAGTRAFCAGADLKERAGMDEAAVLDQLRLYRSELLWLRTCSVPTVAAINGAALGGGLELALLCDLRFAAPSAVLALPETGLGIIPAAGGTQTLPRIVGPSLARELVLLGRRLDAAEAHAAGLVHRVGAPSPRPAADRADDSPADPAGDGPAMGQSTTLEQTLDWIEPILNGAPIAQRAALDALRAAEALPFAAGLERELECYRACLASEDRREALEAFAEKRPPRFSGR